MATEKNLKKLTIHKLKKKTYNALAEKPVDELVMLTDVGGQVAEITEASADYVGEIVQYVGETNGTYTNGYFYKCTETDGVYSWTQVNVQEGGGGDYLLKTDAAATYLPLSGGSIQYLTLTNNANYIGFKLSGSYKVSMRPLNPEMLTTTAGLGLSATILSFGWDDWSARFRLFLDTGTQKLFPNADNSFSLGLSERRWVNIYTYKLNNGADLIVPTEGGTLARLEDINAAVGDISTALTAILGE